MNYADKLDECYKKALEQDDVNLALEIADRMKGLPAEGVLVGVDERITAFIEALDSMAVKFEAGDSFPPYSFDYADHIFEVTMLK